MDFEQEYDAGLMERVGMKQHIGTMYRIPGTGWRIYDGSSFTSPWAYDHDEDGKEYGARDTLADALDSILDAEKCGYGDNSGYREITIPAIQRIIDNLAEVAHA